jgi:CubicO group peptidase (beta-lactamase class C family)
MKLSSCVVLAAGVLAAAAQAATAPPRLDGSAQTVESIHATVRELMAAERVPGVAVALIHDGRVGFVGTYGLRDVGKQLPLKADTVMYGASRPRVLRGRPRRGHG